MQSFYVSCSVVVCMLFYGAKLIFVVRPPCSGWSKRENEREGWHDTRRRTMAPIKFERKLNETNITVESDIPLIYSYNIHCALLINTLCDNFLPIGIEVKKLCKQTQWMNWTGKEIIRKLNKFILTVLLLYLFDPSVKCLCSHGSKRNCSFIWRVACLLIEHRVASSLLCMYNDYARTQSILIVKLNGK